MADATYLKKTRKQLLGYKSPAPVRWGVKE